MAYLGYIRKIFQSEKKVFAFYQFLSIFELFPEGIQYSNITFSGSQHRNEAPSHHDDDHDEDQYTNDTIPDSLKYDPDKFDIEFVIPKRRSRKQKEIKFFTQCNVVLADVHGVLLKPFHEADRENNVVHHVRHRNGDHFI